MDSDTERKDRDTMVHTRGGLVSLHPTVYRIMLLLAAVFILAAWTFFGPGGGIGHYTALVLVVVTLFVGFAIAIPGELTRIWRGHHDLAEDPGAPTDSFRHWLDHNVTIRRDRLSGRDAAIAALLPIAAGAVGMVLFALAHAVVIGGA